MAEHFQALSASLSLSIPQVGGGRGPCGLLAEIPLDELPTAATVPHTALCCCTVRVLCCSQAVALTAAYPPLVLEPPGQLRQKLDSLCALFSCDEQQVRHARAEASSRGSMRGSGRTLPRRAVACLGNLVHAAAGPHASATALTGTCARGRHAPLPPTGAARHHPLPAAAHHRVRGHGVTRGAAGRELACGGRQPAAAGGAARARAAVGPAGAHAAARPGRVGLGVRRHTCARVGMLCTHMHASDEQGSAMALPYIYDAAPNLLHPPAPPQNILVLQFNKLFSMFTGEGEGHSREDVLRLVCANPGLLGIEGLAAAPTV